MASGSFSRLLSDPRVDRTVAVIAIIPIAYLAYMRLRHGTLDIVRINLILQSLLLMITMVARRPPVRVTLNPWFWLLAFVATYWIPFSALAAPVGVTSSALKPDEYTGTSFNNASVAGAGTGNSP